MKNIFIIIAIIAFIGGCTPAEKSSEVDRISPDKTQLIVDFQQGVPLKYEFVSSRDITVDWGQVGTEKAKSKVEKSSESLALTVSYTPVNIDAYGLTTIKAVCESAKVTRSSQSSAARNRTSRQDPAESFAGKSWTFKVDAAGKMINPSELIDVIQQAGKLAFRPDKSKGPIKDPDMIYDFIASQWFVWDSISSVPNPASGVSVGEQWKSVLSVPAPMILFEARDVNYTLAEIRKEPGGLIAVIESSYYPLHPNPSDWPVPYTEQFQMSGTFGFLRGYKVLDLAGQGQELFDIKAGLIKQNNQKYTMTIQAFLPMGLAISPQITIEQTLTMGLVQPDTAEKKN